MKNNHISETLKNEMAILIGNNADHDFKVLLRK